MLNRTLSLVFCLGIAGVGSSVASDKVGDNIDVGAVTSATANQEITSRLDERLSRLEQVVFSQKIGVNNKAVEDKLKLCMDRCEEVSDWFNCYRLALDQKRKEEEAASHSLSYAPSVGENILRQIESDRERIGTLAAQAVRLHRQVAVKTGISEEEGPEERKNALYEDYLEKAKKDIKDMEESWAGMSTDY